MDQFLRLTGLMIAIGATGLSAFIWGRSNFDPLIFLSMLPVSAPVILGGLLISAVGAILENVIGLRRAAELQNRLTEEQMGIAPHSRRH